MNSERAQGYGRVMAILRDMGPSKLLASEEEQIREAADALLFCEDLGSDDGARTALEGVEELTRRLVATERWIEPTAARLLARLGDCGPGALVAG